MRVLVVDDDIKILRFISLSLTLAGYEVATATRGDEALRLLEMKKPDTVILDIFMPGMDGFEVLRKIRAVSELPVIIISAYTSAREEALNLKANDFLTKPFKPDELIEKIRLLHHRGQAAD